MKIIAKFAGKNGSLGYENGRYYSLKILEDKHTKEICIYSEKKDPCRYGTFIKFLENWTDINTQYD